MYWKEISVTIDQSKKSERPVYMAAHQKQESPLKLEESHTPELACKQQVPQNTDEEVHSDTDERETEQEFDKEVGNDEKGCHLMVDNHGKGAGVSENGKPMKKEMARFLGKFFNRKEKDKSDQKNALPLNLIRSKDDSQLHNANLYRPGVSMKRGQHTIKKSLTSPDLINVLATEQKDIVLESSGISSRPFGPVETDLSSLSDIGSNRKSMRRRSTEPHFGTEVLLKHEAISFIQPRPPMSPYQAMKAVIAQPPNEPETRVKTGSRPADFQARSYEIEKPVRSGLVDLRLQPAPPPQVKAPANSNESRLQEELGRKPPLVIKGLGNEEAQAPARNIISDLDKPRPPPGPPPPEALEETKIIMEKKPRPPPGPPPKEALEATAALQASVVSADLQGVDTIQAGRRPMIPPPFNLVMIQRLRPNHSDKRPDNTRQRVPTAPMSKGISAAPPFRAPLPPKMPPSTNLTSNKYCSECNCHDFSMNPFKPGTCNNCFHKH